MLQGRAGRHEHCMEATQGNQGWACSSNFMLLAYDLRTDHFPIHFNNYLRERPVTSRSHTPAHEPALPQSYYYYLY